MTYEFVPDEKDYLTYLYYVTTKSQKVRKKRAMNKLVILFLYFIAGLFLYNSQGPVNAGIFFLLCLPVYFLYGYFEKRQYLRHFTKYIKANYNQELGVPSTIDLDDEGISIAVGDTKTKMSWTEIAQINETGSMLLIEENNQNAIVIPKQKTANVDELIAKLK
ncbi:MAG: YcxB family protein, partial [Saprospiraceae bacterium]